jgi:hypothetical protein
MSRLRTAAVLASIAVTIGATASTAQQAVGPTLRIQPNRPGGVHDVNIVNRMGSPVRVRVNGFRREANFAADLRNQGAQRDRFLSGERIVSVWSQDRRLIFAAVVPFNRSGTLVLRSPTFARGGPGQARAQAAAGGGLPTMAIE